MREFRAGHPIGTAPQTAAHPDSGIGEQSKNAGPASAKGCHLIRQALPEGETGIEDRVRVGDASSTLQEVDNHLALMLAYLPYMLGQRLRIDSHVYLQKKK